MIKKEVKDGSLTYGLVSGTPFAGILNPVVYENATDWDIITLFDDSLLWTDKNYEITNNGPATFEISEDKKNNYNKN